VAKLVNVARPPQRPLMIYDGDCGFCRFWVKRWQRSTGSQVAYLPLQDPSIATQFPELPTAALETAVHLIEPDGKVFSGAEAVFRSLAANPSKQWPLRLYRKIPGAALLAEWGYRLVARHRRASSALTRLIWKQK